jgi:FkbM family methyltransferase
MAQAMRLRPQQLHPAKVRKALRRRWFERRLEHNLPRRAPGVVELGSDYGGWLVPAGLLGRSWVCYCVGAGGDISFDLELIRKFDATVRAFDPVDAYVRSSLEQAGDEPRFSAHQAALATVDGPIRMQVTHDQQSRSVSAAHLYDTESFVELPGRTLQTLMAELGDDHVDLLKLDVEGAEYSLIPTLNLRSLGVKVFAVQLHHTGSVSDARALIRQLDEEGYEAVGCRPAVKLTFARRDLVEETGSFADVTVASFN